MTTITLPGPTCRVCARPGTHVWGWPIPGRAAPLMTWYCADHMPAPVPAGAIFCPVCLTPNPPTPPDVSGWLLVPYAWVCSEACKATYLRILALVPVDEGFRGARGLMPRWPGEPTAAEAIRAMRDAEEQEHPATCAEHNPEQLVCGHCGKPASEAGTLGLCADRTVEGDILSDHGAWLLPLSMWQEG